MAKAETLEDAAEAGQQALLACEELREAGNKLEDAHGRTLGIFVRDGDVNALVDLRGALDRLVDAALREKDRSNDDGAKVDDLESEVDTLKKRVAALETERDHAVARRDELDAALTQIKEIAGTVEG